MGKFLLTFEPRFIPGCTNLGALPLWNCYPEANRFVMNRNSKACLKSSVTKWCALIQEWFALIQVQTEKCFLHILY